MIVAIAANAQQKQGLCEKGFGEDIALTWVTASAELYNQTEANVLIDCLFDRTILTSVRQPLLIHSPNISLKELQASGQTARFCAWDTLIQRPIWEMAVSDAENAGWVENTMNAIGWQYRVVPDEPGFIAPRIISMIINEAFFALEEGVSDQAAIDTAMKLGTNYPFGPFEWAEKIGVSHINSLLQKLTVTDKRYEPSKLLSSNCP
ncbi:MAG: 3-hydroxyacyl-CoA dehydrogenase family protein [Chitinophagaceae bacterium]